MRKKVLRITTVPVSLKLLLEGQLNMLNRDYEVVAVSSPGKELEEVGKREGVRTEAVCMERRIALVQDFKSLVDLIRLIRKEKPWMVHTMTPKAGLLGMLAAWICKVPVRMHTFTGLVFPSAVGVKKQLLILTDRITCACATFVNPEGKGVKDDLVRFGITRKKLHVIGNGNVNGVNVDFFDRTDEVLLCAQAIRKEGCFTFCFVGRIVGDKGINELVEAFLKLVSEFPACRLILVGDFEEKLDPVMPVVRQIIFENEQIVFAGWQDDIRPYLAASDVFVFPSYREGFPNVVLQAGAMGLPCIVTDINGSNEIIHDQVNGLIIPPRDKDALWKAMKIMVTDETIRREMGDRARNIIVNRYDRHLIWSEIQRVYAEL
ncbi:glycosyltransferase family 4 protein [Phocaeicola plebeius]|uniref:glycosyltransferase family 4 protein n=1 Tax=Phocaeicola plebeius TaxID=310297 RepID=UPI003564C94A